MYVYIRRYIAMCLCVHNYSILMDMFVWPDNFSRNVYEFSLLSHPRSTATTTVTTPIDITTTHDVVTLTMDNVTTTTHANITTRCFTKVTTTLTTLKPDNVAVLPSSADNVTTAYISAPGSITHGATATLSDDDDSLVTGKGILEL